MVHVHLVLVTPKADSSVVDQVLEDDHLIVDGLLQAIPGILNLDHLADGPMIDPIRTIIPQNVAEALTVVGKCFQLGVADIPVSKKLQPKTEKTHKNV